MEPNEAHRVLHSTKLRQYRDEEGNKIIVGHDDMAHKYRIVKKKSKLAKGNFCRVKLCRNIAETDQGKQREGESLYALKIFNKLTLRKQKEYRRRPDGMGMLIWT